MSSAQQSPPPKQSSPGPTRAERRPKLGRAFNVIWTASVVSALGDGMRLAALPLLATQLTSDPVLLGAVGAAAQLPWFLLSLQAGALVDRWDRRRVMWRVDAVRCAVLLLLSSAIWSGHATVAWLVVAAFILGCGQVFFELSAQALIPAMVPDEPTALMRANGRMFSAQVNGEKLSGPPLGAALYSVGHAFPFFLDAVSFFVSSVLVGSIRRMAGTAAEKKPETGATPTEAPRSRMRTEVWEGLRWLLGHRVLRALAYTAGLSNIVFSAKMVLLVLLAKDQLRIGNMGYGLLLSATAIGSILGSFGADWVGRHIGPGTMRCVGMVVEGLSVVGLGLAGNAWISGAMMAVTGCSMSIQNVVTGSLRQRIAPPAMLGRVLAASRLIAMLGAPVGALLGGWLGGATSIRLPFVLGGIFMILVALIAVPALNDRAVQSALDDSSRGT